MSIEEQKRVIAKVTRTSVGGEYGAQALLDNAIQLDRNFVDSLYQKRFTVVYYYTNSLNEVAVDKYIIRGEEAGFLTFGETADTFEASTAFQAQVRSKMYSRRNRDGYTNFVLEIYAAIPPDLNETQFPANNVSVESIESEFKRRDLQDQYSMLFHHDPISSASPSSVKPVTGFTNVSISGRTLTFTTPEGSSKNIDIPDPSSSTSTSSSEGKLIADSGILQIVNSKVTSSAQKWTISTYTKPGDSSNFNGIFDVMLLKQSAIKDLAVIGFWIEAEGEVTGTDNITRKVLLSRTAVPLAGTGRTTIYQIPVSPNTFHKVAVTGYSQGEYISFKLIEDSTFVSSSEDLAYNGSTKILIKEMVTSPHALQVNSDWAATEGVAEILNKPAPFVQVKSDWGQQDPTNPAYIAGKPANLVTSVADTTDGNNTTRIRVDNTTGTHTYLDLPVADLAENNSNSSKFIENKPDYFITRLAPRGKRIQSYSQKADGTIGYSYLNLPLPDFGEKDVSSLNYIANKPGINDKLIQVADSGTGMYGSGTTPYDSASKLCQSISLSTGFTNPGNSYTARKGKWASRNYSRLRGVTFKCTWAQMCPIQWGNNC